MGKDEEEEKVGKDEEVITEEVVVCVPSPCSFEGHKSVHSPGIQTLSVWHLSTHTHTHMYHTCTR